ncbi:uncharacterized protein CTRU02_208081 [Colletotrichum truncatum]|uniref:Uncharacterized protein n=1 Tax=Colletotrichum truncatum TaxID=5467 RepID=A0ACC3YYA0_COLTU|nr:uncharacterized protein CTRU02_10920 [Colletotrichum truncatum]KAF6786422.1 hypothetical protein CTRU02_10920 [Colletotrichum truncatum]
MTSPGFYIDHSGNLTVTSHLPPVKAEDGELLIEVLYSGVNPADTTYTTILEIHDIVLGADFCGRVVDASKVKNSRFQVGDAVAGYTYTGNGRPARYGTHQAYLATPPEAGVFKVPDGMPYTDAAALMSTLQSASDALFNRLELPVPSDSIKSASLDCTLIIWGASTTLGVAAVQLARAIGVRNIIVTATSSRHQLLKDLGATHCFDYKDPDVSIKIKDAVEAAGFEDIRGFETVGRAESYRLFLDTMSTLSGNRRYAFSFMHSDERPASEMLLGGRHYDVHLIFKGGHKTVFKARPEEAARIWTAVEWAVANYGVRFRLPSVRVFEGKAEDALVAMKEIAEPGSFGKLVIKQPMQ